MPLGCPLGKPVFLSSYMGFSQRFQLYQIVSVVYVCLLAAAAAWLPEAKPIWVSLKRNAWKGMIYETSNLQEPHSPLVSGYDRAWVRCSGCPHLIFQPDSFNHEHTNWENTKPDLSIRLSVLWKEWEACCLEAWTALRSTASSGKLDAKSYQFVLWGSGFGYGVVVVGEGPISAPPMEISSKVDLVYKKYFRT